MNTTKPKATTQSADPVERFAALADTAETLGMDRAAFRDAVLADAGGPDQTADVYVRAAERVVAKARMRAKLRVPVVVSAPVPEPVPAAPVAAPVAALEPAPAPEPLPETRDLNPSYGGRHAGDLLRVGDALVTLHGFRRVAGGVLAVCTDADGQIVRFGRVEMMTAHVIIRHDATKMRRSSGAVGYTSSNKPGGSGGVLVESAA